jgi:hypothetical protein
MVWPDDTMSGSPSLHDIEFNISGFESGSYYIVNRHDTLHI